MEGLWWRVVALARRLVLEYLDAIDVERDPHVVLDRSGGLPHRVMFTPDDPEESDAALRAAVQKHAAVSLCPAQRAHDHCGLMLATSDVLSHTASPPVAGTAATQPFSPSKSTS